MKPENTGAPANPVGGRMLRGWFYDEDESDNLSHDW